MFTVKSKIVQDYVLLIRIHKKRLEDVPNLSNLQDMVQLALDN